MSLPVNVSELISGNSVEWERLEFKESWDKLEAVQAITSFANDINNWGGGYLIIGIQASNGKPILPPKGVPLAAVDDIQKELINICNLIKPPYFPIMEPVKHMGKTILVIWVPGSETRPHKAPKSLGKNKDYRYYIRRFSSTVIANQSEEVDLIETSAKTPFDDQIQQHADLSELNLSLIATHLQKVGSDLFDQLDSLPFEDLCRKMNIASGPSEYLKPKNIGLLLFSDEPTRFFPGAKIDVVTFKDASGDEFTEKTFSGPIQTQLQDVLTYLKNMVVEEKVIKVEGKAESIRAFNYPFSAVEEAVSNTVYHRGYNDDSPIEIKVYPDRIEIVSFPGPMPPLNKKKLNDAKIVARKYRNRRIGDFLKELRLTEGRGTGIPKILKAMNQNGSPSPIFDTDEDLTYFLTVLPVHPSFVQDGVQDGVQVGVQVGVQDINIEDKILKFCLRPKKREEIMNHIGLFHNYDNFARHVKPLVEKDWLAPTIPDKPNSRFQQYRTTPDGEKYLNGDRKELDSGTQATLV